jgi:hypothetical protein
MRPSSPASPQNHAVQDRPAVVVHQPVRTGRWSVPQTRMGRRHDGSELSGQYEAWNPTQPHWSHALTLHLQSAPPHHGA